MDETESSLWKLLVNSQITFGELIKIEEIKGGKLIGHSYTELKNKAENMSCMLKKLGLERKHIGILGKNSFSWLIAFFAISRVNGISVLADCRLDEEHLLEMFNFTDVEALLYDKDMEVHVSNIKEKADKLKVLICMDEKFGNNEAFSFYRLDCTEDMPVSSPEELCSIVFTSGTTGKIKGVMLSHKNIISNIRAVADAAAFTSENTKLLQILPMHHMYGLTCGVLSSIYLGIPLCINDDITNIFKNMSIFKPTMIMMIPMVINFIHIQLKRFVKKFGLSKREAALKLCGGNLKTIISGGAYLAENVIEDFLDYGIEIMQGYGMTECSPQIATNSFASNKIGSVGKVLKGIEIKILDDEILVRGDNIMIGYYKDPHGTEEAFAGGWLKTGDLGYVTEDNYLYITGRKKYLIILSNGENVSPESIEKYIYSYPDVREALVYNENDSITAEVFMDETIRDEEKANRLKSIINQVNSRLTVYSRITKIKLRNCEFEKTISNKIKR